MIEESEHVVALVESVSVKPTDETFILLIFLLVVHRMLQRSEFIHHNPYNHQRNDYCLSVASLLACTYLQGCSQRAITRSRWRDCRRRSVWRTLTSTPSLLPSTTTYYSPLSRATTARTKHFLSKKGVMIHTTTQTKVHSSTFGSYRRLLSSWRYSRSSWRDISRMRDTHCWCINRRRLDRRIWWNSTESWWKEARRAQFPSAGRLL